MGRHNDQTIRKFSFFSNHRFIQQNHQIVIKWKFNIKKKQKKQRKNLEKQVTSDGKIAEKGKGLCLKGHFSSFVNSFRIMKDEVGVKNNRVYFRAKQMQIFHINWISIGKFFKLKLFSKRFS